jgi:hypothetical protein
MAAIEGFTVGLPEKAVANHFQADGIRVVPVIRVTRPDETGRGLVLERSVPRTENCVGRLFGGVACRIIAGYEPTRYFLDDLRSDVVGLVYRGDKLGELLCAGVIRRVLWFERARSGGGYGALGRTQIVLSIDSRS